jgi:murein L,D-transpeptidase YafK
VRIRKSHILFFFLVLCVCAIPLRNALRYTVVTTIHVLKGQKTITDRLEEYGVSARSRLQPDFDKLGITYPPSRIVLVGLKQEKQLAVWVAEDGINFIHLKTYPILAASGTLGPKLRDGDSQVPEGLYEVESLNPNSMFHLALRLNYPNEFDRIKGMNDSRDNLGSDIMIHGKACSIGCLAMGDEAIEELFTLVADTGSDSIPVILSPVDFRVRELPADMPNVPEWTPELYGTIKQSLQALKNGE